MTKTELKQLLKSAKAAYEIYRDLREVAQELRSLAMKTTPAYSLVPSGGGDGQTKECIILRMLEKEQEAGQAFAKYLQRLNEVRELIQHLPVGEMQAVLIKRYYKFKSWDAIADEMAYSIRTIHRIHANSLKILLKIINQ